MTSFVVLQHEDEPTAKSLEKTVFVRDAIPIIALAFPIVWLFWHRLWVAGGLALALFVAVSAFAGENADYFSLLVAFNILLSLSVAIEGSAWRMAALRFVGYKDRAVVEAENLEQAQLKWALQQHDAQPLTIHVSQSVTQKQYEDDLIFNTSGLS